MGIAKNKTKVHLRSESRRRNHEHSLQHQVQEWKTQELERDMFDRADAPEGSLTKCLEQLAPESRLLIKKHYFDGMTLQSIAGESNRTGGSIRMMLLRIRKVLAKCIRGQHQ